MQRGASGFSLVEMLVVLGILGLILIAVQSVRYRMSPEQVLRVETDRAVHELRQLHHRSMIEGRRFVWAPMTGPSDDLVFELCCHGSRSAPVTAVHFFPDGSSSGGRVTLFHKKSENKKVIGIDWVSGHVSGQ